MKRLLPLMSVLAFVTALSAQVPQSSGSVAGRWLGKALTGTQASFSMSFTLDGANVAGTFDGKEIQGELVGKRLTFGSPDAWRLWRERKMGSADSPEFYETINIAELKDDGTLSGMSNTYMRGYGGVHKDGLWMAMRPGGQ